MTLEGLDVGFAVTGSFCTMTKAIEQVKVLTEAGINAHTCDHNSIHHLII